MKLFNRLAGAFLAVLVMSNSLSIAADELDSKVEKPEGVLMLVNQKTGQMEAFKMSEVAHGVKTKNLTQAQMDALVKSVAVKSNKIGEVKLTKSTNELDGDKATEACWGRCWGGGCGCWGGWGRGWGCGGGWYAPVYGWGCGMGCGFYGGWNAYVCW